MNSRLPLVSRNNQAVDRAACILQQPFLHRKEEKRMTQLEKALQLHEEWKGKLRVEAKMKVDSREALSMAYTPGGGGTL